MGKKCPGSCKEINCRGGTSSAACFQMSKDNCKISPRACMVCPWKYMIHGANHCLIACTRCRCDKKNLSEEEKQVDEDMSNEDEMCHDKHCCGCFCCPLYIPLIPLGFLGGICTWVGSAVCCVTGTCLLCLEKTDNARFLQSVVTEEPTAEEMRSPDEQNQI